MTGNPRNRASRSLEIIVATHSALSLVGVSWAFGGNADWVRTPISIWGSIGIALTLAIVLGRQSRDRVAPGTLPWALPVLALNLLVCLSCLTHGLKDLSYANKSYLMPVRIDWWIPSSAQPGTSLRSLWIFDGFYFSCLNLALAVTRRGVLRLVLAAAVGNALVLSVFGTVQKLLGFTGIYFGAVVSPQVNFFSSFVYDNHWGAFMVIMLGACIGLTLRYSSSVHSEGFFHGPALAGLVAASFMAISIPLSGSRACTLLLAVLLAYAVVQGLPHISRALRDSGATTMQVGLAMILAGGIAAFGLWTVAGNVIQARTLKTKEQVTAMWAQGGIGSRGTLYRDTWRMAHDRLLFGWGMGTFPTVFAFYNTQESKIDRIPVVYHDAHSDWIQSVAEIGLTGTALIGCAVLLPLRSVRRSRLTAIPRFLFAGLILTAAYAWIEFPFGNAAVILSWWLFFFCAIQYSRLTGKREEAAPA